MNLGCNETLIAENHEKCQILKFGWEYSPRVYKPVPKHDLQIIMAHELLQ